MSSYGIALTLEASYAESVERATTKTKLGVVLAPNEVSS